jgi:uroporphyrinogen-III synthase
MATSAGFTTHFRSLIALDLLPQLPDLRGIDLLFFMSPSAVRLFYSQGALAFPPLPVAVMGEGTSAALPNYIAPVFIGNQSTQAVAEAFAEFAGNRFVGVVTGTESRRRIQKALHPDTYRDLLLYRNSPIPVRIPECDIYVFTSPTNAHAFFLKNSLPQGAYVIALGEATAEVLAEKGANAHTPVNYSPEALWDAIISAV